VAAILPLTSAAAPRATPTYMRCPDGRSVVQSAGAIRLCAGGGVVASAPAAAPPVRTRSTPVATETPVPDRCAVNSYTNVVSGVTPPTSPPAGADPGGRWVYMICGENDNPAVGAFAVAGAWVWTRAAVPAADPRQLAQQAADELRPRAPVVDYAPRHHTGSPDATLVGLKTYVWLDQASLQTASKRVSAGGAWAQATVIVQSVSIDPGDGTAPVSCPDGGIPYDPHFPLDQQAADCWHMFTRSGSFQLRVSVTWAVTWFGSGGARGTLAPITVTGNVPVPVQEVQTVNGGTGVNNRARG
jgi:hypothetical protein